MADGLVVGWWIAATVAYGGGVHIDDTCGCLDPELVELELRSAIGDEVVDRVDLRVELDGADHWRLALEVLDGSGSLWTRTVAVEPVDCPYLTALITQSIERGLAELPGWEIAFRGRPVELGFLITATAPWALRIGLGADLWIPVHGALHWQLQPDLVYGLIEGFEAGTVQLTGITLATGPGVDLPMGAGALRLSSRLGAGGTLVAGGGAAENFRRYRPRVVAATDIGWAADVGLRSSIRLEIPVVRLRYTDGDDGTFDALEPPIRLGISLGLAGPVRKR